MRVASARRVFLTNALAMGLGILAGCATAPPHPLDTVGPGYAVAVIPVPYPPESGFGGRPFGETLAQGALTGAGAGAVGSALLLGAGAIVFPPLGIPLALAMAPVLVGTGTVAGVAGAAIRGPTGDATKVPEEQRGTLDYTLNGVLSELPLPALTAAAVARSIATFAPYRSEVMESIPTGRNDLPDYRVLGDRGFGGAIEVVIARTGFSGWGSDGISLFVTAEARLVDTQTGKSTWMRGLVYESPAHDASLWTHDDAALTRVELHRAYRTLAERIVDVLVLGTIPATPFDRWSYSETCGVAPLDPAPAPGVGTSAGPSPGASRVLSLTPALAWSASPLMQGGGIAKPWSTATDLRYDLRIWKAEDSAPGNIVYERFGLAGTRHQVEFALESASTYFWSVRVRGVIDGHLRAAPWSMSNTPMVAGKRYLGDARFFGAAGSDGAVRRAPGPGDSWLPCGWLDNIPTANFHRFQTP